MLKLYAVSAALRRDRLLDGGGNHGKKVVYYILCTTITIAREDAGAQCPNFITSYKGVKVGSFLKSCFERSLIDAIMVILSADFQANVS